MTPPILCFLKMIKRLYIGQLWKHRSLKQSMVDFQTHFLHFVVLCLHLIVASDNPIFCKTDHLTGYFKQMSYAAAVLVKVYFYDKSHIYSFVCSSTNIPAIGKVNQKYLMCSSAIKHVTTFLFFTCT